MTGARGLTAKGVQTRARIIEAAADLMFESGIARTTLGDVERAAGVSTSQVFHYFADKNALVRAVLAYREDGVITPQEALLTGLDDVAGLRAWADELVAIQERLGCRGGCPVGSIGSELGETDPEIRAQVDASFRRWSDAIRDGLRGMAAAGRLAPDADPDDLAQALLASIQGGLLLGQMQRSTRPLRVALDTVIGAIETRALEGGAPPDPARATEAGR